MADVISIPITDIEDFESVDVVEVLVKVGDEVEINQPLVTVESEKATMDYPSPHAGVVEKVLVQDGLQVKEGDILITLLATEASTDSVASFADRLVDTHEENKANIPELKNEARTRSKSSPHGSTAYASPSTQKYARQLGVNLNQVQGTGRKQRVVEQDIQQHVRKKMLNTPANQSGSTKPLNFSNYGTSNAKKLTKIQKLTAENMLNAWQSIPHVTHFDQADVTQLEIHRKKLAGDLKEKNIKLTPLAFVVKALVATLKQFPQFNSSLDSVTEELIYKDYFHIGIAVDTPHGLFVPVIRDVDKKTLEQIAIELVEISDLAKQRKLGPKQMGGASMTISSLGSLGGQAFTPIINPPEAAILGLSKISVNENISTLSSQPSVVQQKLLPLSLSYDHRIINGADAARFCTYLKMVLEDIWKLIL